MKSIIKKVVAGGLIISMLGGALLCNELFVNKESKVAKANSNEVIEFEFRSSALDQNDVCLVNNAVFKTEYFKDSSSKYNHELAQLSLAMAMASSTTAESKDNWGTEFKGIVDTSFDMKNVDPATARNAYIVDVYKKLGFYNDVYSKYEVSLNDTSDSVAYSIAMKDIIIYGKKYKLLICTTRGVSYGAEWASNFTMYNEDGKSGFQVAGEEFYKAIKEYIKKHKLGKNTKVWIPGFSRGAATANVASARLNEDIAKGEYKFSKDDVYSYLYATPQSSINTDSDNPIYSNIFNIVNEADVVPRTAPTEWGFKRYGKVLYIPQIYATSKELERIENGKRVKISPQNIERIKNISYDYNEIRFENMLLKDDTVDLNKLYIGFTVNKDFTVFFDKLIGILAKDVEEYADKYQGVTKEIVPFLISHSKTYSKEEGVWVPYETLADYLCERYGTDVLNEASEAGIFSQEEYLEKIESIKNIHKNNFVNEEVMSMLEYIVDTYYGIRIIAFKYGIDVDTVKELTGNVLENIWGFIDKFNITDPFYCKRVHYAEFYMAWMRNYNPYTQTYIK